MCGISTNCAQFFMDADPPVILKLGEMASEIGYYHFEWRFVTLVMFNIQTLIAVDAFLSKYNQSVILKRGKNLPSRRTHIPQYVLFGTQSSEITDMLKWLRESMYDTSGKFIIVCAAIDYEECEEKEIFHTLSTEHIPNVVVLKAQNDDSPQIYSYRFIEPEKCVNDNPFEINYNNSENGMYWKSLFKEQLTNFYQCPLIVSTFEQPPFMILNNSTENASGIDGDVLTLLTEILNATLVIKLPTGGEIWGAYEDNNWTGSLGDIYNFEAQASMCSIPLTSDLYGNFQISFTYNTMDIVWTAKLPLLKPAWEKLLHPLKFYSRLILILMFLIIVLLNSFTKTRFWKNITQVINTSPSNVNLLFYSWVLFLGLPILRMPSKRNFVVFVYIWIWFSFIIRSCYQAALKDSLKHKLYEKKFSSVQDVLRDKYPFGGLESLREYYSEDDDLFSNWIPLNFSNTYEMLDELSTGTSNFVLAFNKEVIMEYLKQYNGSRKLQIIPEKIVNSPSVIYFTKYSALTGPVNRILKILVECGFIQRVYTRSTYLQNKYDQTKNQYEPMNVKYFAGTIGLLILGWVISIIFFIVEAYCGRLNGK
ncbi:PREDICTED: uncharacterized protein LOC106103659 [Papilio polytes]|uniref:uncharacterized protein LOC106103659 n=1 Tax=Papilio polytes TaxID=76194 RepID=UPI0006767189|nr:PREDICTED: uncharacterized protein LOC106103659 [Papilio polytes]